MKYSHNNILTFFILLCFSTFLNAQTFEGDIKINDANQNHTLILKNGKQLDGKIISIENTEVQFKEINKTTVLFIELFEIEKVMVINDIENDSEEIVVATNDKIPSSNNRLLFTETGFSLKSNQTEYYTHYGFIHMVDYGMTNNSTFGIGFAYPGYLILHGKMNYATGRHKKKFRGGFDFQIAGQPQRIFNPFENKEQLGWNGFSRLSTYISHGDSRRMIHVGLNITTVFEPFEGFSILNPFDNSGLISFNFGGMIRVASNWNFVYENVFGAFEGRNVSAFGLFSGMGVNWFDGKNSLKLAINRSPNFRFFNFPVNELNTIRSLPFVSYSRFF